MKTRLLLIASIAVAALGAAAWAAQSRYPGVIAQAPTDAWDTRSSPSQRQRQARR